MINHVSLLRRIQEKTKNKTKDVIKDRMWNFEATDVKNVDGERDLLLRDASVQQQQHEH